MCLEPGIVQTQDTVFERFIVQVVINFSLYSS